MAAIPASFPPIETYPRLKNILFATDFSACSASALPYANLMARRYGSTVHLVHVVGSESMISPLGAPIRDSEFEREAARELMDRFAQCEALRDILYTVTLERGEVWEVVSRLVRELHADLIILGTHGRRGLKHFVLGSIAEQVFRHAACPVLTVGPQVQNKLPEGRIASILYATDFSSGSLHALEYAISVAMVNNSKLTLVHAVDGDVVLSFVEETITIAKDRLEKLLPENPRLNHEVVVEFGAATDMILKAAKNASAELIVMGAKKAASGAHAPWATAHKVVCYASCPVLTVRE